MERPRLRSIVFDCADPARLARFWAEVLGYRVRPYDQAALARLREAGIDDVEDDPSVVIDPPGEGPTIWFDKVPEGKVVKNRVHLDVNLTSVGELERLAQLGARVVRPFGEVPEDRWAIMADPEGNKFCAFPPEE